MMNKKIHLLFICCSNQWPRPTAENLWKNHTDYVTLSAGTSPNAKKTVSTTDIRWADHIFVMEQKQKNRLKANFTRLLTHKKIHVLHIPDEYQYIDENLINALKVSVHTILQY